MSEPVLDEAAAQGAPPPPLPTQSEPAPPPPAPSPADLARAHADQAARQQQPPADDGDGKPKGKKLETIEDYEKALADARKEAADRRVKLRELEPLAEKYREIEESKKDEVQKAIERAEAAEKRDREREEGFTRLNLAVTHGIDPDNIDLIGSGSREDMEARALRVKSMQDAHNAPATTAPPSNRPVEGLRPGASPEPPGPADDSYPESWKPNHVRERERSQYGQ